jgi:hypothetical protein
MRWTEHVERVGETRITKFMKISGGKINLALTCLMEVRMILKCITGNTGLLDGTGLKMRASGWGDEHAGNKSDMEFLATMDYYQLPKMNCTPWNSVPSAR